MKPDGEYLHEYEIADERNKAVRHIESQPSARYSTHFQTSVCPGPAFMPDKILKDRTLHRYRRRQANRPLQAATQEGQDCQLHTHSHKTHKVEFRHVHGP